MVSLFSLAIFSTLAFNLVVHCGLGIPDIAAKEELPLFSLAVHSMVLFVSVVLLVIFFKMVLIPLSLGFMAYLLFFPLSFLVCSGLERGSALVLKKLHIYPPENCLFSVNSVYNGMVVLALIATLHLSLGFIDTVILAFGFALGVFLSTIILFAIVRRSVLEVVPPFLQGFPFIAISAGLLSLIFTVAAQVISSISW
ncbi:MAG: hypothetical protein LBO67_07355 [Spirochaetaceae bacterium]|jgi:Na+-translocating ferredoxin:NAD+ oxidoreductase RnfA subunit|nr:hypothetical protein [Spirochaetaceae bacterium]